MNDKITKIHPNSLKNLLIMGVVSILLAIGGALLIVSGGTENEVLTGMLFVLFFGSAIILSVRDLIMLRIVIVLTPDYIEHRLKKGAAYIRWGDIEKVGVIRVMSHDYVGIRLNSYDYYLEAMSPPLARNIRKLLPYRGLISKQPMSLDKEKSASLWSKLKGKDFSEVFIKYGKVGNLAKSLLWARNEFGYEIMFSWYEIDRSEKRFVKLLESYRASDDE